jgi:chromate transporter
MNLIRGIPGGYTAALALALPSIIIIIVIARTLKAFKESPVVAALFTGFRPAAAGLLSAAGLGAILISLYNPAAVFPWTGFLRGKETLLFIVLFLLIYRFKKHPVVYLAGAAAAGIALGL